MSLYWHMPVAKQLPLGEPESISRELSKKKEKRKRLKRTKQHEPFKRRKHTIHQQYKNSKPRDSRFSDQQKLRRMYRNH